MALPVRHSFTMRIDKTLLVRLQEKAFKDSMKELKPISTADLVLKALKKVYPELFSE